MHQSRLAGWLSVAGGHIIWPTVILSLRKVLFAFRQFPLVTHCSHLFSGMAFQDPSTHSSSSSSATIPYVMFNALVKCPNERPTILRQVKWLQLQLQLQYVSAKSGSRPQSSSSSSSSSSSCDTKKLTLDMHFESNKTETHEFWLHTEFPISAPAQCCHVPFWASSIQHKVNRAIRNTGFCYTAGFNCQNDAIHCLHALSCSRSIHNVRNTTPCLILPLSLVMAVDSSAVNYLYVCDL